jgi:uncharacterized protein YlxW (UPF0749 family)
MDNFISNLWKNNKIFFFILLPLVIIWFFKDLILKLIVGVSNKELDSTKKADAKLQQEQNKINDQANAHKANADKLENEIKNISEDEEWHKKR